MKPGRDHTSTNSMRKKHLQHVTGLCVEDARDTLVEPSVEPEERPEVDPVLNRPLLNMLGDTLGIAKHLPAATCGDRTQCGTRRETRSETCA